MTTRKELKQPDAFQKAGAEAVPWLVERRKAIVIGIVIALLGFGGVAIASWASERGEINSTRELGQAMAVLTRPVDEKATTPPPDGEEPPFKSQKDKDEALIKSLTDFRKEHSGSKAAADAALPLAQARARQGAYDDALKLYDEYLKSAQPDPQLKAEAMEGKGYALESKGQLDQAMAAFDELAKENKTEFLKGMGEYHHARLLIAEGKKEDAARMLAEIPGSAPNSAAARLANERMAVLAAEGVNVPPPSPPKAAGKDGG